ncbi:N-acetylmuramoyl-L-alanine amidase [Cohnella sp. AR92]|uniref:N-acetylmuramoyl-L-alanine amidase family protein n=1 Tax=Cohnella sp. AR92 TaxID=648716 RepID=UPI000F8E3064|nr:N-acetylmuramoyl-L-alanine amidase [Cohnella sp. AR92]RUS45951.1 N-acetylmuramoyl-L-alanine amidase [Cohnella sp. AR92]
MRNRQAARSRKPRRFVPLLVLFLLIAAVRILMLNGADDPPAGSPSDKTEQAGNRPGGDARGGPFRILIDAGHGGIDPGAEGASGAEEKDMTLSVARKVYELLRNDPLYEVHMTREDDSFIELEDRADISNDLEADAFLSIHGNKYDDPSVSGIETYYDSSDSLLLAQAIHDKLIRETGFNDRGIKREDWTVLALNERPSILMELGFLSNPEEESRMRDPQWQDRVAEAIVDGLNRYFGG